MFVTSMEKLSTPESKKLGKQSINYCENSLKPDRTMKVVDFNNPKSINMKKQTIIKYTIIVLLLQILFVLSKCHLSIVIYF